MDLAPLNNRGEEERPSHRPELNREEADQLRQYALEYGETSVEFYGRPLVEVIAHDSPWRSWLEGAVLAGFVPHLDGLVLALRANHLWTVNRIREATREGVLGDAIGWTELDDAYDLLIGLLHELRGELRARRETLLDIPVPRRPQGDVSPAT